MITEFVRELGVEIGVLVCVLGFGAYILFGKCPRCGQRFSVGGCHPAKHRKLKGT